jgi:hypothetical protein
VARLGRRADHREHETLRAHVHRSRDVMIFFRGRSHDDGQIRRLEISYRALHGFKPKSRMLEVEEHEIASGRLEYVTNTGRCKFHDEMPELGGLGSSKLLEALRRHCSLLRAAQHAGQPLKSRSQS